MMTEDERGMFCIVYGNSLRNRVLEYMLEMKELDYAAGDIARQVSISRPKAYTIIEELEKQGILKKSRIVAGTQLYMMNTESGYARLLKKSFNECLKLVIGKHAENARNIENAKPRKAAVA